ncbi:hypothetical protein CRE_27282 [Caenorhabditis remanei]|uniref:Uncharacterized protein n=1 Tax=Caenorhabditis remanei TaxID=31234 RepID=E3LPG7_CAERE|nr:hypothetical protein CRE_27282 [Caenorhabditis remanei]
MTNRFDSLCRLGGSLVSSMDCSDSWEGRSNEDWSTGSVCSTKASNLADYISSDIGKAIRMTFGLSQDSISF